MRDLDLAGTFWIADKPERRVAGRLTFSDAHGLELGLIGSLHDPEAVLAKQTRPVTRVPLEELLGSNNEPVRILGETTEGYVTLDHCLRTSGKFPLFGVPRTAQEVYSGDVALLGAHFCTDEPLVFTGATVRIQNFQHWVGMSSVSIELDYDEDSKELEEVRIVDKPRENLAVTTRLGKVNMVFESVLGGDHVVESTIRQNHVVELGFLEPQSLRYTLGVCTSLRDLVTIGTDGPAAIDSVSLSHADLTRTMNFYAQLIGTERFKGNRPPHPREMLFTFEGIGGLQGLAKWLEVAQKYELVVAALVSPQYRPPWYVEHRFFDGITATETLVRIRTQQEHINRHKVKQLAHKAGAIFEALVGDVDQWTDRVWDARRDKLIHRGLHEDDRPLLYWLAESLYFLVVLCLLNECGVSDGTLASIQQHRRFQLVARELRR